MRQFEIPYISIALAKAIWNKKLFIIQTVELGNAEVGQQQTQGVLEESVQFWTNSETIQGLDNEPFNGCKYCYFSIWICFAK